MSAQDYFIQVAADGAGKKVDGSQRTTSQGVVSRQRIVIGGDASDNFAEPTPDGYLSTKDELNVALLMALESFVNAMPIDPATGRLRVLLDAITGALTLATITTVTTCSTVTTVSTVTNQSQMGTIPTNSVVFDAMNNSWANQFLRCVS